MHLECWFVRRMCVEVGLSEKCMWSNGLYVCLSSPLLSSPFNLFFYNRHGLLRWAVCCIILQRWAVCCIILQSTNVLHLVHNFVRWVRAVGYFVLFFNITKDWSCSRQFAATEVIQNASSSNHNSSPNVSDWGRGHFVLLKEKKNNHRKVCGLH